MDDPSNPVDGEPEGEATMRPEPAATEEPTTECYETEDGIVFYDADNPLAWIQASGAVRLDDVV